MSESNLVVRGTVDFPSRSVQATSTDVVSVATINMIDPSNNNTVGTATTNAAGAFTLVPNTGFNPVSGVYYILDAVKGLNTNQPGNAAVRLRTLITWDTTPNVGGWKSLTNTVSTVQGGTISIRTITTALALINSFDGARVPGSALIGKVGQVSGQWVLSTDALVPIYDDSFVNALDAQIQRYLAADADPVATINSLKPEITAIDTPSVSEGQVFTITGKGFSPVPTQNSLVFNTSKQLSGGQVFNAMSASSTKLTFKLPGSFPLIGAGWVAIIMNNQQSDWAALTTTYPSGGSGGSGGGGGGGSTASSTAPQIVSLSAGSGVAGDTLTITGKNFTVNFHENLVSFPNAGTVVPDTVTTTMISVHVPAGAKSGPLQIFNPNGESNAVYFAVYSGQKFDETFANTSKYDAASSTALGWKGGVVTALGPNPTLYGTGTNDLTVTSGTQVGEYYTLSSAVAKDATLVIPNTTSGLAAGDELMFIRFKDPSSPNTTVGPYEFVVIDSISGSIVVLKSKLKYAWAAGSTMVRVKHYGLVTVKNGGSIYPPGYDGNSSGVLAIRASKGLVVENGGAIHADARGYRGGQGGSAWMWTGCNYFGGGYQGEDRLGNAPNTWRNPSNPNNQRLSPPDVGGAGQVSYHWCCWGYGDNGSSGGGSHATAGGNGVDTYIYQWNDCGDYSGRGNGASTIVGTANDSTLTMGGGGAGAYTWNIEGGVNGGSGGGIVYIAAPTIEVQAGGRISANGGNGSNGSYHASGSGAGGSVLLVGGVMSIAGQLRAAGGSGTYPTSRTGCCYGAGGSGRIKLTEYVISPATPSLDSNPSVGWEGKIGGAGTFSSSETIVMSKGYDTGVTRPYYTGYSKNDDLNGQTTPMAYEFSESADNSSWSDWAGDVTGFSQRYVRWRAKLKTSDTGTTPVLKGVTINYRTLVN